MVRIIKIKLKFLSIILRTEFRKMLNKLISLVLDFSYELDHFVALVKAHLRIFPDFFYDWQLEKVFLVFHV